jgi:hypothetical protein
MVAAAAHHNKVNEAMVAAAAHHNKVNEVVHTAHEYGQSVASSVRRSVGHFVVHSFIN